MTTRRLIVLRHAKSSWPDGTPDHERPLNRRGQRDAPHIGAELAANGWIPEFVCSSDAMRTRQTWQCMAEAFSARAIDVLFTRRLYLAGLSEIRACAAEWPAERGTVMVIGHNPGWEEAVASLAGCNEEMTTGNAACLVGAGATWAEALAGTWALERMIRPSAA